MVAVHFDHGRIDIQIDRQHLSRITEAETHQIVAQLLMFGGNVFRQKISDWIVGGKIEAVAEYISPNTIADSHSKEQA